MLKVWICGWDTHNSDSDVSLHTTAKGAIDAAVVVGLSAKEEAECREALDEEGYWQDREDDPHYCCWVREEIVQQEN